MSLPFLRASKIGTDGTPQKVYEASTAGNTVKEDPPAGIPESARRDVDLLEFFDPATGTAVFSTRIIRGSLKGGKKLWEELKFAVRCWFVEKDDPHAAPIELFLELKQGSIRFKSFEVFGSAANPKPNDLPSMVSAKFESGQRSGTPPVLKKLGLAIEPNSAKQAWKIRTSLERVSQAGESGFAFVVNFPLDEDANAQGLVPFKLEIDPALIKEEPRGCRIDVVQRPRQSLVPIDRQQTSSQDLVHSILEITKIPAPSVLRSWNKNVARPYLASLDAVRAGLPLSFMPAFDPPPETTASAFWRATFSMIDRKFASAGLADEDISLRDCNSALPDQRVSVVARTLEPGDPKNPKGDGSQKATVVFPNVMLTTAAGNARELRTDMILRRPDVPPDESRPVSRLPGIAFETLETRTPLVNPIVRAGALDLVFGGETTETERDRPLVHVSFRTSEDAAGDELPELVRLDQCELRLNVQTIAPGSQDGVPGEEFARELESFQRQFAPPSQPIQGSPIVGLENEAAYQKRFLRSVPHILPLSERLTPTKPFRLRVFERAFERRSQTLSLQLQQPLAGLQGGSGALSMIVIDEDPFLVAKVEIPNFLADLTSGISNEIGNWTNRATDTGWELLSGSHGFDLVLPPQAVGETMQRLRGDNDVELDKGGVDFRFSPPARARVQSTLNAQRFVEAGWNMRRILGYPGQRDPGSIVDALDFEILYGLKGRLKNRFVRIAEIGARLGAMPGRQVPAIRWRHDGDQQDAFLFARNEWSKLYPVLSSRLGVLELRDQRSPDRFHLTTDDGLKLNLRESADLAYPIRGETATDPKIPKGTLKGSYSWAFESKRLYEALWRNPVASSGEINGLFLSALGGWGQQVARFDNDRARVITTVRMGRVESLAVERIGCIGIFRHRAKHVIVYKRTVTPGEQFAKEQDQFRGVALLRKFEEYVELLEPKRDFGVGAMSADRAAFVRAYQFLDGDPPRIRVDSRWGDDVGTYGWRIPLWKPAADQEIYPKPHSCFWMDCDKPGEPSQQRNDEPHKLYFYTTVDPNLGPDTDTWPMADAVDYRTIFASSQNTIRGTSAEDAAELAKNAKGDVNAFTPLVADRQYEPGLGAFTFALAPSRTAVNVVADRVEATVGSALHSVTVMRGLHKVTELPESKFTKGQDVIADLRDHMSNALRPALARVADAPFDAIAREWGDLQAEAKSVLQDFDASLAKLSGLAGGSKPICEAFQLRLRNQLDVSKALIAIELEARLQTLVDDLDRAARAAGTELNTEVRKKAKANVDDFIDRLLRTIAFGKTGLTDLAAQAGAAATTVTVDLTDQLSKGQQAIEKLAQEGKLTRTTAKEQIRAISGSILSTLTAANQAMARLAGGWTGAQLGLARAALQRASADVALWTAESTAVLDDSTVTDILKACTDRIAAATALATAMKAALEKAKADLDGAITNYSTALEARLEALRSGVHKAIADATNFDDLLKQIKEQFNEHIKGVEDAVAAQLKSIADAIESQGLRLCQSLLATFDDLVAMLRNSWNGKTIDELFKRVRDAAMSGGDAIKEVERFLHAREEELNGLLAEASRQIQKQASPKELEEIAKNVTDGAMQLLRAFGDKPIVPQLDINLPRIAFRFAEFDAAGLLSQLPEVNITPLVAKANELGGALNPIALKVPSIKLGEKFLPFRMEDFDLAKAFPNFGGLDLSDLFKGVRLPATANDHVKVTHGFDIQRQSGWVQIDVDVPFGGQPAELFSLFGVTVTLLKGRFTGVGRVEGAAGEAPRRVFRGAINGDWELTVGGTSIAILRDCTLTFDDAGHIGFNVTPDRIELQAILKFLAEILSRFNYNSKGFSITLTPEGLMTALDLPLPNVQAGTFGIANLSLSFFFGLRVAPFEIQIGVGVARRLRPFTLSVFILGGAGFFQYTLSYRPHTKALVSQVSIGIYASASLAISLGPISGGVYAYFGVNVEYLAETGRASEYRIAVVLLFVGEVTLLGFISVSLSVGLQLEYRTGGQLIGRGFVSYSIKIGPFFEIDVSCGIEYHYGNPGALPAAPEDYLKVAHRYLDMFSN